MFGVSAGTDRRSTPGSCCATLAVACLFVFGDVFALGLGKLRVKSALDEPLVAEIELTSVQEAELETLEARLSSREDFIRANVDRPEFLGTLQFDVARDAAQPTITIRTEQAAKEPFVHFLVTVQWAGGELIREYTALLDPPTYALDIPSSVSSPRVVDEARPEQPEAAAEATAAVTEIADEPAADEPAAGEPAADEPAAGEPAAGEASPAMVSEPPTAGVRSGEYGPTQKGDTLWSIASKLDVGNAEINIFQVMIALLRENPDAFVNFNINRLKVGKILKLDNIATVAETTRKEASVVYTAHLEEWQAYRLQIAQASQTAMVPAATADEPRSADAADPVRTTADSESMAPKEDAAAEAAKSAESPAQTAETAATEATENEVLRIVRANLDESEASAGQTAAGRAAEAEAQALKDQLQLLEETLTSRELENKELRERVALLETQVEKTNRLIDLQSEQMAQMQEQAAAAAATAARPEPEPQSPAAPAAPAAAAATGDQTAAAKEVATAEVKQAEEPEVQPDAKAAAVAPKVAQKPKQPATEKAKQPVVEKPTQPAAKPKPKKTTRVAPKPKMATPWWQDILDSLLSSWQYLVGLGIAAVALLVGLLQMIRRRRSIAEFEESILSGSVLDGQTDTTDTTRATGATDTSFLSDFGMAGMGTVQADEVDPLAESEVYLAYGRDEQAEEVLKEAIKKDSGRHELKLKLLEIYQQRNDLKAFETLAEELYPAGDKGDSVIWQQVVAMGRTMNPHNPLFSQELPAVIAAASDKQQGAENIAAGMTSPDVSMDGSLQPFPEPQGDSKLEAELEKFRGDGDTQLEPHDEVIPGGSEPAAASESVVNIEETLEAGVPAVDDTAPEAQTISGLDDVDFDLDFEALEAEAEQQTESDLAEDVAEGLNFDVTPPPSPEIGEAVEQRVANVTPLPGNKTTAPAPTVDMTPESTTSGAPSQPAEFLISADLEDFPTAGVAAGAGVPGVSDEEIQTNLEELAATVSDMDDVGPPAADHEQWDEAATKLDLARAYIDMGDNDGARSIIDEVLKQGNPTQRTQAQELANQLSG